MAEAILSQISGKFLECTICLEPFKDPKMLPCLHTFCKGCLEMYVANRYRKDKLPCAICRTETVLPESGVDGLKDNVFFLGLAATLDDHKSLASKQEDEISCSVCDEEVAICGCVVCEEFLCVECARDHDRAKRTRDHEVISVAELKGQRNTKTHSVKTRPPPICPKHNEKLMLYCETCQHPICRQCTLVLPHKDHKYGHLTDFVGDVRAKIRERVKAAMSTIEDITSDMAKKQAELNSRSKKAADDIDAAAEEDIKYLSTLVRHKQAKLKEKLAAITAARSKQLSDTADSTSIDSNLGCLSSTVDFSRKIVEHGSDFDVMNVYSDTMTRLEYLLLGATPNIPDDISSVVFDRKTFRKEREVILGDIVEFFAKFTTLGAIGRLGPTTLGDHYKGQGHEHLVTLHDGIQHFTVPRTGTYSIEAAGAGAGWSPHYTRFTRGQGAVLRGTFYLNQGKILKILVGQEGDRTGDDWSVGGGGGTFVTKEDNTPLIIAGGAGGGGTGLWANISTGIYLCDGTVSTTGNKSFGNPGCSGGSNGQGATEWLGGCMGGGGGGGLLTDGGSSEQFGGDSCERGGEGGKAFVNGGVGGRGDGDGTNGGFGGGGGGYGGGGGGGGYSGGGRGDSTSSSSGGGGGGSFNSGTKTSSQDGANDGPGYVVIARLL